jgi:hypothetical protein
MKTQEYTYNFKGGGFNSEYATSLEEAIIQAKNRWSHTNLVVDETSFRILTEDEERKLMNNFY